MSFLKTLLLTRLRHEDSVPDFDVKVFEKQPTDRSSANELVGDSKQVNISRIILILQYS